MKKCVTNLFFTSQDVERGVTHSDLYILSLEDKRSTDTAPVKWKWQNSKPGGDKPSPRSGASSVQVKIESPLYEGTTSL